MVNLALLFLASVCWAGGYLFISWADKALSPLQVTAGQTLLGALAVGLYVLLARRPVMGTLRAKPWLPVVTALTAVALPNLSTSVAEEDVPAALASLVGTTVPILTLLLAVFVTRTERYSNRKVAGIAVALTGLLVFVGLAGLETGGAELSHVGIMMAGGAVFAVNGILMSVAGKGLDMPTLTFWLLLFAAILLGALALVVEGWPGWPGHRALLSLLASGLVSTGLAFLACFVLIERAGPSFAASYAFLVPPLGFGLGVAFEGETVTATHIAGIVLVLAGLWLMSSRDAKGAAAAAPADAAPLPRDPAEAVPGLDPVTGQITQPITDPTTDPISGPKAR
ncbi:DMT family transporter [Pseudooceanicola sp. HF7]|uniref:DMT family transporter n=1 Tax=Pseudooceanicola sp. HF7 TaxID=2721560 RepID=UPI0014311E06|nr:DMT family transporter [Pseudooceanicola sp. HF7]NIZ10633.1 DMT family transporter [Pseudooceanicola sp. HF7]